MDEHQETQIKQMRMEVTELLKVASEQASIQTLLLGAVRAMKVPPKDIEAAIDSLKLHPMAGADLKRRAKKMVPLYFP